MTARVIPMTRSAGRGRQPVEVEQLRDSRDELRALVLEGVDLAALLVAIARRAQRALAAGRSCANDLDELERLALRHGVRMAAAAIEPNEICPDGATVRRLGCGKAA